ncbi:DUF6612 family protein [Evansella cellulosilytica]|uniref:Prolow-density lipoprotein receptor-related protein 1-like beta-propeller domain-containing protein n=1 Tax=Evansella cellulosilytica (strain ATCC 21833 / DSM 2522 / FERM P-1141 / JCM 9156 / N-4) TaxID=649639 RepID=E6TWK2_EVAC2|nr:DUF6612 family protein [Evansella cellulosilytica]ADU32265.1 hypothetical protein Bcell_4034 [Evansella cellulosilytica DSM 2522]
MNKHFNKLCFLFVSSAIFIGCSNEELTAIEVLENTIDAMDDINEFRFVLDSHAEDQDGQQIVISSEGNVQYTPLAAHMKLESDYDDEHQVKTEVYISDDAIYHQGTRVAETDAEWIGNDYSHTPPTPHEQFDLIKEFSDSFTFIEERDYYHFTLSTYDDGLDNLLSTIFPFFHVQDDPLLEIMLYILRSEGIVEQLNYEFTINKDTFMRESELIELLLDVGNPDIDDMTFMEQINITYDYTDTEPVFIPDEVIDNARKIGENMSDSLIDLEIDTETSIEEEKGISDGNHFNGAKFTTDGEWIYFADDHHIEGIYRFKADEIDNHVEKLSDDIAANINVTDDWIYYEDRSKDSHVYRMSKDGSEIEQVISDNTIDVRVIDETLYYKNFNGHNQRSLYATQLSPTTTTTFTLVDHVFRFTIHQGNVFYQGDDHHLYVTDVDPNDNANFPFISHRVGTFQALDEYIYYENSEDGHSLYRISTDGYRVEKLTEAESQGFNVTEDSLFFTNASDDEALYRLDLDTLEKTKLDDRGFSIHVIDDLVFYQKHISSFELGWFVINKDGTNPRQINF